MSDQPNQAAMAMAARLLRGQIYRLRDEALMRRHGAQLLTDTATAAETVAAWLEAQAALADPALCPLAIAFDHHEDRVDVPERPLNRKLSGPVKQFQRGKPKP